MTYVDDPDMSLKVEEVKNGFLIYVYSKPGIRASIFIAKDKNELGKLLSEILGVDDEEK